MAVAEGDYHSFFRLHITAPLMSGYLMDYMVSPMRVVALQRICKAYRPDISLSFVLNEVGYTDIEMKEGKKWIQDAGFKLTQDGKTLVTTESEIKREMLQKHNSLI